MTSNKTPWLAISVAVSFFAVGISYWRIPYNQLNLPDALLGLGLIIVVVSAGLLRLFGVATFWRVTCMLGASVAMAVMARVVIDVLRDPTSHNLWPFELVIAMAVGFACAFVGAFVGGLIARLLASRAGDEQA